MTKNIPPAYPPEMIEIMQRLFRLKDRFRAGVPENLIVLREHLLASNLSGKTGHFNNFDLFHNICLIFSQHEGPITMGELSRDLNMPLSSATRVMDWLVENGYVQRLPDPQDRRVVRVELTEAGEEIYAAINQLFMKRVTQLMSSLTAEERQTFTALLLKMLNGLETQL